MYHSEDFLRFGRIFAARPQKTGFLGVAQTATRFEHGVLPPAKLHGLSAVYPSRSFAQQNSGNNCRNAAITQSLARNAVAAKWPHFDPSEVTAALRDWFMRFFPWNPPLIFS
jgi:hypothetical protein